MNEYFDNDEFLFEEDETSLLIERFLQQISNNEPAFFASDDFLEIIDYFFEAKDYDNIVASLNCAIKLYPDNVEIAKRKCGLITEYIDKLTPQEQEENLIYYRSILIDNYEDNDLLESYVIVASRQPERSKQHIAFLEVLAKTNPYSTLSWFSLALLSLLYGLFEETLDYIEYALALDKTNLEANRCKAEALISTDKTEEGIAILLKILKQDSENSQIHFSLGGAYEQKEEWERAMKHYKQAFSYDEFNFSALMNIGLCYFYLNDFNTAKHHCERAISAEPDNAFFKISYANMLYEEGFKQDAEVMYRYAYDHCDEKEICALNWALSLADDGRMKDLKALVKICPELKQNKEYQFLITPNLNEKS
jgi:tetratricopeptide (TPR) repeat protein